MSPRTGQVLAEGKTKKIMQGDRPDEALIISKDDITAGDGTKHDVIVGKARLANRTTCNVFRLLQECGLPVAFIEQLDEISFVAPLCQMLPYEVVVRREAHGSYLKRLPNLAKGHPFTKLETELFLKTNDRRWKEHRLPCDDPLMNLENQTAMIELFLPNEPIDKQSPFLVLSENEVFTQDREWQLLVQMKIIARQTFLALEKAWQMQGRTLVDFKVEFGIDADGRLLLADVIDNDSWRVVESGHYLDKQVYRDGGDLNEVTAKYRQVADITDRFDCPEQCIISWSPNSKGQFSDIDQALDQILPGWREVGSLTILNATITNVVNDLEGLVHGCPNSVVIYNKPEGNQPLPHNRVVVPTIAVENLGSTKQAVSLAVRMLGLSNPHLYRLIQEQLELGMPGN